MIKLIAGLILILFLAVTIMLWIPLNRTMNVSDQSEIVFEVVSGDSANAVIHKLKKQHFITSTLPLQIYARLFGLDRSIQSGEYYITLKTTPISFFRKLKRGDVVLYSVTLLEGKTLHENIKELNTHEKLQNQLDGLSDSDIINQLGISPKHPLEGLFFPDTYFFRSGETALSILKRAYDKMAKVVQQEWQNRAPNLPYTTPYEALIMASLIERETAVPQERSRIAGVFVNRLRKGMRLQTDPTVIYGLGDAYQGKINKQHLRTMTPYNTYLIPGLPPTPISLFGIASLRAALHPEKNKYLFFVAKGDGYHYFSETLEKHNEAVRQYQLNRREDYRANPNH